MAESYEHQSYPKCIYLKDRDGQVTTRCVQSPDDLKGLAYAESPAGPFVKMGAVKSEVRARERLADTQAKTPRKTKRSKA
mgnify:CR=1 FL=1|jgi:hypothetical protein